ncbi:tetratricopeptide repeat protein [Salipiger sp. P9]|uniref:tetratricopeptide repeat protein n=1 Tax=Salipiger pentaromativorans TaxID=2943193 RepID=UPI002157D192|nr:tetratricopeptide repeat protein [Salipiger pentaromativorans]MCR8550573.1 tetratricopeptide repeat protein [Salipiger pentaromativorans]
MTTQTLSRKEKRAAIARASKLYGLKGDDALAIHNAYLTMQKGDLGGALRLAHPVTQRHPGNPHGWILLGSAALSQREGETAKAFFAKAVECAPKGARALAGLGKAHVLCAEVEPACAIMEQAIDAGSKDVPMMLLYLDLTGRLGRRLHAAKRLEPLAQKLDSADLAYKLGLSLQEVDETKRAAICFERAYALDPAPEAHQIAQAQALLYTGRVEEAEARARELLETLKDRDQLALVLLTALRLQRKGDEALGFAEAFEFATPEGFAQARGMVANVLQDQDDMAGAEAAYQEAMHIAGEQPRIRKAYGVFCYRDGRYAEGAAHYEKRLPALQRRQVAVENAAPENLAMQDRVFLMAEQGIGDQIALMSLLRLAPLKDGAEVTFVGDPRHGPLLDGNALGLGHMAQSDLNGVTPPVAPGEMVFLGDLTRYLPDAAPAARQGAYLTPDAGAVDTIRTRYEALAEGRPIFGLAWASRSLIGALRSLPLSELVAVLPEGAFVVDLQYGDTRDEIAAAKAARPDLLFHSDPQIDQMTDLAGFAAQLTALDRVITIDNTTAHLAGALGLADAHLLLPAGSECMWYWGGEGSEDPWYATLTLHRQRRAGDWSGPLAELAARWAR